MTNKVIDFLLGNIEVNNITGAPELNILSVDDLALEAFRLVPSGSLEFKVIKDAEAIDYFTIEHFFNLHFLKDPTNKETMKHKMIEQFNEQASASKSSIQLAVSKALAVFSISEQSIDNRSVAYSKALADFSLSEQGKSYTEKINNYTEHFIAWAKSQ